MDETEKRNLDGYFNDQDRSPLASAYRPDFSANAQTLIINCQSFDILANSSKRLGESLTVYYSAGHIVAPPQMLTTASQQQGRRFSTSPLLESLIPQSSSDVGQAIEVEDSIRYQAAKILRSNWKLFSSFRFSLFCQR